MSDLTDMEEELSKLDKLDESGVQGSQWRLKRRYHKDAPDNPKNELLDQMEKKLTDYGILTFSLCCRMLECQLELTLRPLRESVVSIPASEGHGSSPSKRPQ
jgi:hypothetical protein